MILFFLSLLVVFFGSCAEQTSEFRGNLHQLWLNGEPVGLWNFNQSSSGCAAAVDGYVLAEENFPFSML